MPHSELIEQVVKHLGLGQALRRQFPHQAQELRVVLALERGDMVSERVWVGGAHKRRGRDALLRS